MRSPSATASPLRAITQSHGDDLYRRSMYTFWKRTSSPPSLVTFDAPDREKCTARRLPTNTPLQALVLLNDPTYVEAARALAQRALLEGGKDPARRIRYAFRLATARLPDAKEIRILRGIERKIARRLPQESRQRAQTLSRRRIQLRRPVSMRRSWRRGPRSPAPFSTSTRPSPRSKSSDVPRRRNHPTPSPAVIFSRSAAPASARRRWPRFWRPRPSAEPSPLTPPTGGLPGFPNFPPKAKRVIFLHQSGAPSQIDLFDYKPKLDENCEGTDLPDSIRKGQRITGMTSGQSSLPVAPSDLQVPANTANPAPGSANCCRTRPRSSTTSPSSRP